MYLFYLGLICYSVSNIWIYFLIKADYHFLKFGRKRKRHRSDGPTKPIVPTMNPSDDDDDDDDDDDIDISKYQLDSDEDEVSLEIFGH